MKKEDIEPIRLLLIELLSGEFSFSKVGIYGTTDEQRANFAKDRSSHILGSLMSYQQLLADAEAKEG